MKWKSAQRVFQRLPWVQQEVDILAVDFAGPAGADKARRKWVENTIAYIAVRPLDQFNLDLKAAHGYAEVQGQNKMEIVWDVEIVLYCQEPGSTEYQRRFASALRSDFPQTGRALLLDLGSLVPVGFIVKAYLRNGISGTTEIYDVFVVPQGHTF